MPMLSLGIFFANSKGSNFLSSRELVPVSTHDLGPPKFSRISMQHMALLRVVIEDSTWSHLRYQRHVVRLLAALTGKVAN